MPPVNHVRAGRSVRTRRGALTAWIRDAENLSADGLDQRARQPRQRHRIGPRLRSGPTSELLNALCWELLRIEAALRSDTSGNAGAGQRLQPCDRVHYGVIERGTTKKMESKPSVLMIEGHHKTDLFQSASGGCEERQACRPPVPDAHQHGSTATDPLRMARGTPGTRQSATTPASRTDLSVKGSNYALPALAVSARNFKEE